MAKKALYYDEAERLYVMEHIPFDSIAKQLDVSEKTLRNWAQDGQWQEKRAELERDTGALHSKLYKLANTLTDSVQNAIAEGREVPSHQLYTLTRILDKLQKLRQYEETAGSEEAAGKKSAGQLSQKTIERIEQDIFGIR